MARFFTSKLFTNVLNKSQKFPQHNAILIEYKLRYQNCKTNNQMFHAYPNLNTLLVLSAPPPPPLSPSDGNFLT